MAGSKTFYLFISRAGGYNDDYYRLVERPNNADAFGFHHHSLAGPNHLISRPL